MGLFNWLFGTERIGYIEDEIRWVKNQKLKAELNMIYGNPSLYQNNYWRGLRQSIIEKGDNDMKEFKPVIYKGTDEQAAQTFFNYLKRNIGEVTHASDEDYTLVEALFNKSTKCTYEVTACYNVTKKEETPEWVKANPGLFYKIGDRYCVRNNHEPLCPSGYRFATKYFDSSIQIAYVIEQLFGLINEKGYFTMYDLKKAAGMPMFYPSDGKYVWRVFDYHVTLNGDNQFCLIITTAPDHVCL